MGVWAQIDTTRVTTVPPDGSTVVDIYAEFSFGAAVLDPVIGALSSSVPTGTTINFLVGKGTVTDVNTLAELQSTITPIDGVELIDSQAPVDGPIWVRGEDGTLVQKYVAKVSLKPISDILKDNITVAAYSTFDKLGTATRFAADSVTLTVSSGEGTFFKNCERYKVASDTWEDIASIPTGRSGLFTEMVNSKIYAIGGFNANFIGVNEEYNPINNTWTTKEPMPIARGFGSSVVIANEMYIIGGYNYSPGRASDVFEKYNPTTDTWTTLTPLPFPIAFSTAVAIGTDIWVFYGAISFSDTETVLVNNTGIIKCDTTALAGLGQWTIEDTVIAGATSVTVRNDALVGAYFLDITKSAAIPVYGFVTVNRGGGTQESVRYTNFQDGTLLLQEPLAYAHVIGETVIDIGSPRTRLSSNSYVDIAGNIKVFNGFDGLSPIAIVESFNITTKALALTGGSSNLARCKAGQAMVGTDLYVIGGSAVSSDFIGKVEKADTTTDVFTGPTGFSKMTYFRTSFGCTSDNTTYVYAISGIGGGHEPGWVKLEVLTAPGRIKADGRQTATATITATDSGGDSIPDGVRFKARGLLYITNDQKQIEQAKQTTPPATTEKNPPASISILPVLFSSNTMLLDSGEAATVLLPRSEDYVNEVQNLLNFVVGNEAVINQQELKKSPASFSNSTQNIGQKRDLYSVAVEVSVDPSQPFPIPSGFYFGQSDSDSTAIGISNQPLASTRFSFNPPAQKQGGSGTINYYSNITAIPDIQLVTSEPVDGTTAISKIEELRDEIPFGASPHFDSIVVGANNRIVDPPALPLLPPNNFMVTVSDNEDNSSTNSPSQVVTEVNLVDGAYKFPVFITTVIVTDPISLAARKARTDVADLEQISSDTGGNSFSLISSRPGDISFIIDRIKTSAPSSMGSGTITVRHTVEGAIFAFTFVLDNMIPTNSAQLTARYSDDGYNFYDTGVLLQSTTGTYPAPTITTSYTLSTPITAKVIEYTVKLASKTFSSPILKSVTIQYVKANVQYLFTYPQNVNGQIAELASVTNQRLPSGGEVEVGVSHGDGLEFDRDYVSITQPGIQDRGTILALNRDAQIVQGVLFRDTLETDDFIIYTSKSGPWAQDAIIRVFIGLVEALPGTFITVPEKGQVIFKNRLNPQSIVSMEVQNISNFRVGLKITNPSIDTGLLDSFAFMYGETEAVAGLKPNRPPVATNLFITPSPVTPGGPIEANYTFVDPDGDTEDTEQTQIVWFRNGTPVTALNNKHSFTNNDLLATRADAGTDSMISRGQTWFFSVRPHDSMAFGPLAVSHSIVVANVPPTADNAILVSSNVDPLKFTSSDDISVSFSFADPNSGDISLDTIYTFYVNGLLVKTGNSNVITASEEDDAGNKILGAGKTIMAEITPSDGIDFGPVVSTAEVTITGSPPTVTDVSILPATPSQTSNLILKYNFVSVDKNQDRSTIAWFVNDVRIVDFDDITTISSRNSIKNLIPGDQWFAIVTPADGNVTGTPVKSNIVLIQN